MNPEMLHTPEHHAHVHKHMRRYHVGAAVLVVVSVLLVWFGYTIHAIRSADDRVVSQVQDIANQIEWYLQRTGSLPDNLNQLESSTSLAGIDYTKVNDRKYSLCATFKQTRSVNLYNEVDASYLTAGNHQKGYYCFSVMPNKPLPPLMEKRQ